jgi:hypothetical protein
MVDVCTAQNVGSPAQNPRNQGRSSFVYFQVVFKYDGRVAQQENPDDKAVNHGCFFSSVPKVMAKGVAHRRGTIIFLLRMNF